jgi:hypothetical protein
LENKNQKTKNRLWEIFIFVNRTIADWNQLPEGVIGFSHAKINIFSKRLRKAITMEGKESEIMCSAVRSMYENCSV